MRRPSIQEQPATLRPFRRTRTCLDAELGRWPHQQGEAYAHPLHRSDPTGPLRDRRRILIACRTDTIAAPSDWSIAAEVVDQNVAATYGWHAGDAFTPPLIPPDVAEAANGDRVTLTGTGTLTLHTKSATGGGTFTNTTAGGTVLATGTFTATELLSFESYGPSPLLPAFLNAGQALIRVALVPDGSTTSIDGILRVECVLPGSTFPGGKEEGINLLVPGIANFNHQVSGATVFVRID